MNDMLGQRENQYSVGSGWVLFRCSHSGRRSVHLELRLSTPYMPREARCGLRRWRCTLSRIHVHWDWGGPTLNRTRGDVSAGASAKD